MEQLLPFVNIADYILHWYASVYTNKFIWVREQYSIVDVLMEIIFRFRDDRSRSTWKVRNVNHVFRAKNLRSDSHSCKWNKSTFRDLRRSRSLSAGRLPSRFARGSLSFCRGSRVEGNIFFWICCFTPCCRLVFRRSVESGLQVLPRFG